MSAATGLSQQFCVRWNSHLGSLGAAFPQLLAGQRFVDVTLACEGHQVHCHRLVLAACSTYFENLLGENPCKHPIIILPRDIKLWAIQALVDFMYKGEVNVSQAGLPDLMKCAEILKIRGLCGSDAALNLNQLHSPPAGGGSSYPQQRHHSASSDAGEHPVDNTNRSADGSFSTRHGDSRSAQHNSGPSGPKRQLLNSLNLQPIDAGSHHHQTDDGSHSDNGESGNEMCIKTEDLMIDDDDASSRQCADDDLGMESNDKASTDAIRCEQFLSVHAMDAEDRVNDRVASDSMRDRMEEEMEEGEKMIGDRRMTMMVMSEKSDQSANHTDRQDFVQDDCDSFAHENEGQDNDDADDDDDDDIDNDLMEVGEETEGVRATDEGAKEQEMRRKAKAKARSTVHHSTKSNELLASQPKNFSTLALSASSLVTTCSKSVDKSGEPNALASGAGEGAQRTNGTTRTIGSVPSLSSISTVRTVPGSSSRGSIRVKSIENLFENYQAKHQSPKSSRDAKRKSMPQSSVLVLGCSGGANVSENDSASEQQQQQHRTGGIASSLLYNRNETDIYVKQRIPRATERHADGVCDETNASTASDGDGYENIICSPNFPQLSEVVGGYKAEEDDEEEEYGEEYAIQLLAEEIDSSMLANGAESEGDEILYKPPALMAIAGSAKGSGNSCANNKSSGMRTYGRVGGMGNASGATSTLSIRKVERDSRANLNMAQARTVNRRSKLTGRSKEALHQLLNTNGAPPPIAFTLRNPRGNQPRTYNTEALWAALMDVKAGESIYRASQMHKVPRKTLRNWMKRWDIKSAYPMPRQLKEAAEKKRIIKELTSQIQ
ncbi:longitudinals lacking protein-like isoform X2 [Anopheles stephensi]|uniref:longitudinals lacking protein-like isoform X2 n=1 Tax=Anopheles stephensi TaxID=30069 RepID=UPI0016588936|nr:longitudinals lacking protein-like isoform X2 [Anopheles stephensi]